MPSAASWAALRHDLAGELLLPEETGYGAARRTADVRHDAVRPTAVLRCATEHDIGEALRFARRYGVAVHTRAGGHSFAGFSTGPGLVLDVSPLDDIEVDLPGARVHCGAGVRTGAFAEALDAARQVVPTGLCPTVGVTGLTLGGGMGTTGRRHGFALDSLTSARVVLADGHTVHCDAEHHPGLFWALRGGGPLFPGVVASLSFRTRAEEPVTDFLLGWPAEYRARVLTAWQEWAPGAPDRLSSMAGITAGEVWDGLPPAAVGGSWLGEGSDLERQLSALVAAVGRGPDTYTTASHGHRASLRFWGGSPRGRLPLLLRRHDFFARTLPGSTARELIAALERDLHPGESRNCDFEALGGAYNRVPEHATAMVHRSHLFGMLSQFRPGRGRSNRRAATAALDRLHTLVAPWASGYAYQNYAEADRMDWRRTYFGANYPRLAAVREHYDPHGLFRVPFPAPSGLLPGLPSPAGPQLPPGPPGPVRETGAETGPRHEGCRP
ncbi:FAD-binding oxidoreductase [Streptomyces axinellae]|uniref:FAD-binding oxidoreductase n=1 Tax=Streptomyces axinellae TaxID=552788 RepID=A0ABN3PZ15_9ACTN